MSSRMSNVTSENCLLVAHQARRQLNKEQNVRGGSFDVQAGLVILEISFKHTCTKKIFMHTAAKKISHLFSVEKKNITDTQLTLGQWLDYHSVDVQSTVG